VGGKEERNGRRVWVAHGKREREKAGLAAYICENVPVASDIFEPPTNHWMVGGGEPPRRLEAANYGPGLFRISKSGRAGIVERHTAQYLWCMYSCQHLFMILLQKKSI
jgi:hypothetical protein